MKRIKRKGGKYSSTQSLFTRPADAWKQIQPMIDILTKSEKGTMRVALTVEWEPVEVAVEINKQELEKERERGLNPKLLGEFEATVTRINQELLTPPLNTP